MKNWNHVMAFHKPFETWKTSIRGFCYLCRKSNFNTWESLFFPFWFPWWEVASKDTNTFEDILFLFYSPLPLPLPFLPGMWFPKVIVVEQMLKKRAENKILVHLGSTSFQMLNRLKSDIYAITFYTHKAI